MDDTISVLQIEGKLQSNAAGHVCARKPLNMILYHCHQTRTVVLEQNLER